MANHGTFELPENDHLADMVVEALQRFAQEDDCTPAMWAGRAVRSTVVSRLRMEAAADGQDTLSAQRRPPKRLEALARQMAFAILKMEAEATPVAVAYANAFYREFPHLTEEAVTAGGKRD